MENNYDNFNFDNIFFSSRTLIINLVLKVSFSFFETNLLYCFSQRVFKTSIVDPMEISQHLTQHLKPSISYLFPKHFLFRLHFFGFCLSISNANETKGKQKHSYTPGDLLTCALQCVSIDNSRHWHCVVNWTSRAALSSVRFVCIFVNSIRLSKHWPQKHRNNLPAIYLLL